MPGIETPVGKTEEFCKSGEYPLQLTKSKALCLSVHSPGRPVPVCLQASPFPEEVGEAPEAKVASPRAAKYDQALHSSEETAVTEVGGFDQSHH